MSMYIWKGIINAERYTRSFWGDTRSHPGDVLLVKDVPYLSKTMLSHTLHLLLQHVFVAEESRCLTGLQVRSYPNKKNII